MGELITMPALSPMTASATLGRWLVREGDTVEPGDPLAEIETEKAAVEYEAVRAGRIARLLVPEGSVDVAVGTPIAWLLYPGEADPEDHPQPLARDTSRGAHDASRSEMRDKARDAPGEGRVKASPRARREAARAGLNLREIAGSGPNNRIIAADIAGACRPAPAQPFALIGHVSLQRLEAWRRRAAECPEDAVGTLAHLARHVASCLSGSPDPASLPISVRGQEAASDGVAGGQQSGAPEAAFVLPLAPLADRITLHLGTPLSDIAALALIADPARMDPAAQMAFMAALLRIAGPKT
ncbi:biotin/lipoyl-containing protein [Profundibacterium mesophilum]|uniref:Pyruvate dehydrogenase beta subunit n=1 Tax=Profundibacterium mesophilum KAUST100406-0324 TaxID=1037889 RepID=A0A921NY01_9RHOB|nr:biotin/lipoyl-containing protein [Profundibacterium mesophilum]KAF0677426.1 Pyruvate dehydrogenase beta subunit [Profundibacterium mesophilum KAUST100406-0324]